MSPPPLAGSIDRTAARRLAVAAAILATLCTSPSARAGGRPPGTVVTRETGDNGASDAAFSPAPSDAAASPRPSDTAPSPSPSEAAASPSPSGAGRSPDATPPGDPPSTGSPDASGSGPRTDAPRTGGSLPGAAAAVFPGLVLHGAGHFVAGERDDATRLLVTEGVALLTLAGGMTVLALSGAADPLAPVYIIPTVGGLSVFLFSWLVDVVGAARGSDPWPLAPPPGTLTLTAGWIGLFSTPFEFHHGLGAAVAWRGERLSVAPWAVLNPAGDYDALGGRVAYAVWQPGSEPVTRLSAVVSVAYQRFRADRFRVLRAEAYGELRLDLGRVASTMRNAYVLWRLGAGVEGTGYDARRGALEDASPLLVVDAGVGAQVTRAVGVDIVYHQQKNELPGGLVAGSGFLGMLELDGRVALADGWALLPGLRYGGGLMPWVAIESRLF